MRRAAPRAAPDAPVSGYSTSLRLIGKLKASGIIPRNTNVLLKRRGTGWYAVDLITREPLGISSKVSMKDLLEPARRLTVDAKGRVS